MSVKHIKKYYNDIQKMYFELVSDLKEMERDLKAGTCTEEELNNLLLPVKGIEENYKRLSYIMYLLYQPNRDNKKDKYNKANKEIYKFFNDNGLTKEKEVEKEKNNLKEFRDNLKQFISDKEKNQ